MPQNLGNDITNLPMNSHFLHIGILLHKIHDAFLDRSREIAAKTSGSPHMVRKPEVRPGVEGLPGSPATVQLGLCAFF